MLKKKQEKYKSLCSLFSYKLFIKLERAENSIAINIKLKRLSGNIELETNTDDELLRNSMLGRKNNIVSII